MRPLDAYHGNHHTFWPRLYSAHGRHSRRGLSNDNRTHRVISLQEAPASPSSGLSDSVDAKATDCRPEVPHASPIGVGSDGRTADAGIGTPSSPPVLIPASVFEVLDRIAEERS